MDTNTMKNMIILKDLPSNIVEEAFIVFKDNVKIHSINKTTKSQETKNKGKDISKDYIINEAQMVVQDYLSKIEKKEYEIGIGNKTIKEKYKRLKSLTIFLGMFCALSLALIILK